MTNVDFVMVVEFLYMFDDNGFLVVRSSKGARIWLGESEGLFFSYGKRMLNEGG